MKKGDRIVVLATYIIPGTIGFECLFPGNTGTIELADDGSRLYVTWDFITKGSKDIYNTHRYIIKNNMNFIVIPKEAR